jgi:hypothetical protein
MAPRVVHARRYFQLNHADAECRVQSAECRVQTEHMGEIETDTERKKE